MASSEPFADHPAAASLPVTDNRLQDLCLAVKSLRHGEAPGDVRGRQAGPTQVSMPMKPKGDLLLLALQTRQGGWGHTPVSQHVQRLGARMGLKRSSLEGSRGCSRQAS